MVKMKLREKLVFEYKNEFDTYHTTPFSLHSVVLSVMNKMPELVSTDVLLVDDLIKIRDGYTKEVFEGKCIKLINKYYTPKGELTKNTIRPKEVWDRLMDGINTSFYQLKRKQELYMFRIVNGYRVKIAYDKNTDERDTILRILAIKDAERAENILEKNLDRELVYQREAGAKPYFAKRNIEALGIIRQGLLKERNLEVN